MNNGNIVLRKITYMQLQAELARLQQLAEQLEVLRAQNAMALAAMVIKFGGRGDSGENYELALDIGEILRADGTELMLKHVTADDSDKITSTVFFVGLPEGHPLREAIIEEELSE